MKLYFLKNIKLVKIIDSFMFISLKLVMYPAYTSVNVKMPTTFMSRMNFSFSCAEHEKSFLTSGPVNNI